MTRIAFILLCPGLLALLGVATALPPLLPPHQRLLQGPDAEQATTLERQITQRETAGDYAGAIAIAEELLALRARQQGPGHWQALDAKWNLDVLRKVAALPEEQRKQWQNHVLQARLMTSLEDGGRFAQAHPVRVQALALRKQVLGEDHLLVAYSLSDLGYNHSGQGKLEEALACQRQAQGILRKHLGDEHPLTAAGYANMGHVLGELDRPAEAEPMHRRGLELRRAIHGDGHDEVAISYNNLAFCLDSLGRYGEAEPMHRRALAIWTKVRGPDHVDTESSYTNLANNLGLQRKHVEAEPLYRQAVAIMEAAWGKEHVNTATAYNNLAYALNKLGQHVQARGLYERALAIYQKVEGEESLDVAMACNNLAATLQDQLLDAEAEPLYRKALAIRQKVLGENAVAVAQTLGNVAHVLEGQGKLQDAEEYWRRSCATYHRAFGMDNPETLIRDFGLANNLLAQGKQADGLQHLLKLAPAYEAARLRVSASGLGRAGFAAQLSPYQILAATLARASRFHDAYAALEKDLARGYLDEMRGRRGTVATAAEKTEQKALDLHLRQLEGRIQEVLGRKEPPADQDKALASLLAERTTTERKLAQLAATLSQRAVKSLADVQARLAGDQALVCWIDCSNRTGEVKEHWGCVVRSRGEPAWVRLPGTGPLGAWATDDALVPGKLRTAIAQGTRRIDNLPQLVDQLRMQRLAPLAQHLQGVRHLFVVAMDNMAGVPVELLADSYVVSYVASGTHLATLQERKPSAHPAALLAVADPAFAAKYGWKSLPGTRAEVQAIAPLFQRARLLLGEQATERQLATSNAAEELKQYGCLHLATHGVADRGRWLNSALILATDPSAEPVPKSAQLVDGKLTAQEVLDEWELDADLVVLSACESAQGRSGGGEGLLGFSQAFLVAGSRSVVLSLWPVSDRASALLMVRFYQNWLGKRPGLSQQLSKAQALHEAKQWLRGLTRDDLKGEYADVLRGLKLEGGEENKPVLEAKPFADPFYWAAFVLIGDPN